MYAKASLGLAAALLFGACQPDEPSVAMVRVVPTTTTSVVTTTTAPPPTTPATTAPPPRASRAQRPIAAPPAPQPAPCDGVCAEWGLPSVLRRIGGCESSGRPDGPLVWSAQNPRSTASGAFQVLDGTWDGYAGYSRAVHAPPAVQVEWAKAAYAQAGTRPWRASRHCWD